MAKDPIRGIEIELSTLEYVQKIWDRWGLPIVTLNRCYMPADVEGLALNKKGGEPEGLITWAIDGTSAEIVTLDAFPQNHGYGSMLIQAAEEELRRRGVKTIHLVTTNDNHKALRFYCKHGYRLKHVHMDA